MLRLAVFFFCVSLIGALPAPKNATKTFLSKSKARDLGHRIVNGQQARPGQFPYQVAIIIEGGDETWFCGGSLISDEWILTAGHCVDGAEAGVALTGSIGVYDGDISDLYEAILHEGYDGINLKNDIGLLRVLNPLRFDSNTGPIELATDTLGTNVEITVSGWGLTSDDSQDISDNLNYATLETISNTQCNLYYGIIGEEMVCAVSPTSQITSTCNGDSGGPVTVSSGSSQVQVAIASFVSGEGCESGAPSGYTRTAYYRDWIRDAIGV